MAHAVVTVKNTNGSSISVEKNTFSKSTRVTVTGRGFDETVGIYLALCVVPKPGERPTPCGGGVNKGGTGESSYWISSNPPPDMQATALIEKGKNLYSLGDNDPANYRAAIEVWKQIAAEHPTNPAWRNEALTRIGTALEKTGDLNTAVATYYDVFKPTAQAPAEFFWFYKAGFAAARILESTQKWPEAIRVYETLAATDGPRSLEAKNRIKQLRLEHFLWDGE
jgi:hypothetical protein